MSEKAKAVDQKRRERPIEASEVYVPEDARDFGSVFRKRLVYLMNGNNALAKSVNIQELADAVGVSRPAIRKYLRPREPATPSALVVCRIAEFFGVTPNFLLGFDGDGVETEAARLGYESEFYNALGLNQRTLEKLRALHAMHCEKPFSEQAGALLAMLDRQICAFADDAIAVLGKKG